MFREALSAAVWRRAGFIGLAFLFPFFSTELRAQNVSRVFLTSSQLPVAGQWYRLRLCCINDSSHGVTYTFRTNLVGTLTCDSKTVTATLYLHSHWGNIRKWVKPGDIVEDQYGFWIPTNFEGQVVLHVRNCNPLTLMVRGPSSRVVNVTPQPPYEMVSEQLSGIPGLSHFFTYEPIYFLLGAPLTEFQFSLKYQLFSFERPNVLTKFLDDMYLGYTQTSYWVLLVKDPYFYDNSYKPSAFYYATLWRKPRFRLDLQGGTEHESNGRGAENERSFFTYYLQPTATFFLPVGLRLTLQPRIWDYYDVNPNNADIAQYRGYADIRASLTWIQPHTQGKGEKIQFETQFRTGDHGSHTGLWFTLRFNFGVFPALRGVNPTIQVQYFTGYGQTLMLYNRKSQAFRAGICLWYY